jgi:hypothetical protein
MPARSGVIHCWVRDLSSIALAWPGIQVRVEITGSQKCGIVGKSQSVLMVINPIIFTRPRTLRPERRLGGVCWVRGVNCPFSIVKCNSRCTCTCMHARVRAASHRTTSDQMMERQQST